MEHRLRPPLVIQPLQPVPDLGFEFYCGGERIRISYWIASGRRIIALTVFAKTRMRETAEVARATAAMARCQAEGHTADEEDW